MIKSYRCGNYQPAIKFGRRNLTAKGNQGQWTRLK